MFKLVESAEINGPGSTQSSGVMAHAGAKIIRGREIVQTRAEILSPEWQPDRSLSRCVICGSVCGLEPGARARKIINYHMLVLKAVLLNMFSR